MSTQIRNKFTVVAAAGLLTLTLTITPARAHHDHDFVAPLIAGFALGALVNYDRGSRHYYHYRYQRHGHYSQKRRHSSSHVGYHKPRHKH